MDKPVVASDASSHKYQTLGFSTPNGDPSNRDDESLDISGLWMTIRRRKWIILLTCLLVTAAVTAYTLTLPRMYSASSIVSVETNPAVQSAGVWPEENQIEVPEELGLLRNSSQLSRKVGDRLSSIADTVRDAEFSILRTVDGEEPSRLTVVNRLEEHVSFAALEGQAMIEITATSQSPEEAKHIASAYAEEYRHFSQEMARAGLAAAREFLEQQVEKQEQKIQTIEQEWESFAVENDVPTDGNAGQRVASSYVDLETRRDKLKFELEQNRRMKSILESQLEKLQPTLRSSVMNEQRAQSLRTQIQALEEELAQLELRAGQYYMNNPDLKGNEERVPALQELKRRIEGHEQRKTELTEQLVALTEEQGGVGDDNSAGAGAIGQVNTLQSQIKEREMEIQRLEAQINGLDEQIAGYQSRLDNIPRQAIRQEQIQRRLAQAEQFYEDIYGQLQETSLAEESELGYVTVVRSALVPRFPVSPNLQRNVLLGILLGLGFGTGLAFITQAVNSRVIDPEDIQTYGYNLLGVVPKMDREIKSSFDGEEKIDVVGKELSTTLLPLLNPWSPVTENYRLMRTSLQYPNIGNGNGERPKMLMVTSPEPSDGKTTTAANLAITFALSGRSVLLLDADLRRPNAHNLLGLSGRPGLADVLSGRRSLEDVQQSFIEGLTFVAAGDSKAPPAEMLDSDRMRDVISRAREQADVVIVDTPPVLATSDALVVGVQSDATLVVAHAGKTDRRALEQVEKTLGAVGVPMSAVIFNRFDVGSGYDYGYKSDYPEYYAKIVS